MMKLELINKDFPDLLSDESFNVTYPLLLKENMNPDSCLSEIISFSHKNSLETILDYEFSDKTLLVSDSLHENTNSISKTNLITLGKSLIELVVFTNLWTISKLDTHYLIFFKNELCSDIFLNKLVYAFGLYKFVLIENEKKPLLDNIFKGKIWDTSFLKPKNLEFSVNLADFFSVLFALMFLDSNSITLTLQLLGYFFFKPIIFCVKYKIKFKKLLVFKVLDLIKTSENKIEFKELDIAGVFTVKTFVDNEFLFEKTGETIKSAKIQALIALYKLIY